MAGSTSRLVVETLAVLLVTALVLVTAFQFGAVDLNAGPGAPATPTPGGGPVVTTPPADATASPSPPGNARGPATSPPDGGSASPTPVPDGGGARPAAPGPDDERTPSPEPSPRSTSPPAAGGSSGGSSGGGYSPPDVSTPPDASSPVDGATPTPVGTPSFAFELLDVTDCGLTCRTVTATLENGGSGPAEDVSVDVTIYAGSRQVWRGTQDVGSLPAGGQYTVERDVDVGIDGAAAIQANGGVVDVVTVVHHAGGVERFSERYEVR